MRRALLIIVLLFCGASAFAQQTTVTGTIVDANGTAYAGCNITANYQDPPPGPNITRAATINGSPLPWRTLTTACNAFGVFTFVLWDTNAISYGGQTGGGTWQYTVTMTVQAGTIPPWFGQPVNPTFSRTSPVCPAANCITGASVDITTTLQPIPLLPFLGGLVGRLQLFGASKLIASDFTFTGWGTGATLTNINGSDSSFSVTMTAGTSPSINPSVTLNFHDGPWTTISSVNAQVDSGTGNFSDVQSTNTNTSVTLTYMNLPVATKTYIISVTVVGTSNLLLPSALINAASQNGNNIFSGSNTFTKPIISTVSTGTAPLVIASTTQVANLNASLLGGLSPPASAIVGISDTQILTNKTLTAPTITSPTTTGTDNGTETLGSKTLTSPTTTGTDSGTETLTNKTFDISLNTLKTATNTAGHFPRNNGTQYVDNTIQSADLPATTSNCIGQNFAQGLNAGGTPICTSVTVNLAILAYSVTTESSNTALTSGTLTSVNSKAVTFPSSGCPCRVAVYWSQYLTTTGSSAVAEVLVSDGTNNFAESEWPIPVNNGPSGWGSGMSPVTYANSANITFTVKIQVDATGVTAQQAPFHAYGGRNSRLEITVYSSN